MVSRLAAALLCAFLFARALAAQETFGPQDQALMVQAWEFAPDGSGFHLAHSSTTGYVQNSPASVNVRHYVAPLRLPAGALLHTMRCEFWDNGDASKSDVQVVVTVFNTATDSGFAGGLGYVVVTGGGGFQEPIATDMDIYTMSTVRIYPSNDVNYDYQLNLRLYPDDLFRHCVVVWRRTVPTTNAQSFGDVPPGDPLHDLVEALYASGISAGCGNGNYCPDAPVTRGQLALFLARALGLYWPK
jgi:hypothetical protein